MKKRPSSPESPKKAPFGGRKLKFVPKGSQSPQKAVPAEQKPVKFQGEPVVIDLMHQHHEVPSEPIPVHIEHSEEHERLRTRWQRMHETLLTDARNRHINTTLTGNDGHPLERSIESIMADTRVDVKSSAIRSWLEQYHESRILHDHGELKPELANEEAQISLRIIDDFQKGRMPRPRQVRKE